MGSSGLWQFHRLPLFLMIWTALRSPGQMFCRKSFNWDVSDGFSSWLDWGFGIWGGTTEVKYHAHHITSRVPWSPSCSSFVSFLHCKIPLLPHPHPHCTLEKVLSRSVHIWGAGVDLSLLEAGASIHVTWNPSAQETRCTSFGWKSLHNTQVWITMVDLSDTLSRKNAISGKKEDSSAGNSNKHPQEAFPGDNPQVLVWGQMLCASVSSHTIIFYKGIQRSQF